MIKACKMFFCRFFLNRFPVSFNLFVLLFLIIHTMQWLSSSAWSESQFKKKMKISKMGGDKAWFLASILEITFWQ